MVAVMLTVPGPSLVGDVGGCPSSEVGPGLGSTDGLSSILPVSLQTKRPKLVSSQSRACVTVAIDQTKGRGERRKKPKNQSDFLSPMTTTSGSGVLEMEFFGDRAWREGAREQGPQGTYR